MAEASIPVDLFNPGQVFASLGFLEAADVLLRNAEGGFDWSNQVDNVRFMLRAPGDKNPFGVVLQFLAEAEIQRCAPKGYADPSPKKKKTSKDDDEEDSVGPQNLKLMETFPQPEGDLMTLPVRLEGLGGHVIDISHWADGSRRNDFKLYAGNRSAASIARDMLRGKREKRRKKQSEGALKTRGIDALWNESPQELEARPFDVLTLLGGSFNFDPRGAWTAIDLGYSLDRQKKAGSFDGIEASPVVELLAALGLEHARPNEYDRRQVRYGVWSGLVPPILARPALMGVSVGLPVRTFRFTFGGTKHNKVVTFAQEETYT